MVLVAFGLLCSQDTGHWGRPEKAPACSSSCSEKGTGQERGLTEGSWPRSAEVLLSVNSIGMPGSHLPAWQGQERDPV